MAAPLHEIRFPGEGRDYREARNELLLAELELRRQVERVAAQRRSLPLGGELKQDYVFDEIADGGKRQTKFSDLFGKFDTLVVYNYMFSPRDGAAPCPMCTSMLDALDGEAKHVTERAALAVVPRAPVERVAKFAKSRGWRELRLLSSSNNSFNADYHGEMPDGSQIPVLHSFVRRDGQIFHTWSSELLFAPAEPGQNSRHVDMIWPLWNLLDVTREGRGAGWFPKLNY
ncbi:MAG: DUF899 family protein [Rhizomicrobium sp.]|jgi:predicted dithiol-disulfide oxidoreductase (DUF899 family)